MFAEFHFNTKPQFVKRKGVTILGLYSTEKLARKMTKSNQVLRRPPGLTIDAEAYGTNVAGKADWYMVFDISDGRRYWITVPEFDLNKKLIDRGQGQQWVIEFRYLHRDDEDIDDLDIPVIGGKSKSPQLSFSFGGNV
jgi:hypothetical protein